MSRPTYAKPATTSTLSSITAAIFVPSLTVPAAMPVVFVSTALLDTPALMDTAIPHAPPIAIPPQDAINILVSVLLVTVEILLTQPTMFVLAAMFKIVKHAIAITPVKLAILTLFYQTTPAHAPQTPLLMELTLPPVPALLLASPIIQPLLNVLITVMLLTVFLAMAPSALAA